MSNAILLKDGRKLRDVCKEYNLNIQRLQNYKSNHPELSYDEILNIYLNKDKSLAQTWRESNLECSYDNFKSYVRRHPEMTIEQVINKLREPREPKKPSIRQIYESSGLDNICTYGAFKEYVKSHKEMTVDQIIYFYKHEYKKVNTFKREKSLKQIHAESGLVCTYGVFKAYVSANRDKTIDEVIEYLRNNYIPRKEILDNSLSKIWRDNKLNCNVNYFIKYVREHPEEDINNIVKRLKKSNEVSLASVCEREGLNTLNVRGYMRRHPDMTLDEVIAFYKEKQKLDENIQELKLWCENNKISFRAAMRYKADHNFTNEQVIQYYLTKEKVTFSDKCRKLGISVENAMSYRTTHKELTDEQIFMYYRPDCYINIFGELVIPEK